MSPKRSGLVLVVSALMASSAAWQPEEEDPPREIMWRKLDLSHDVLDALALEDFEALEAYTEDLDALTVAGIVNILDTDDYRTRAHAFRRAVRDLGDAARERNAEAGALAYMDMTIRCIRCHRALGVVPR